MATQQTDEMFGQILRAMIRQEVASMLESRDAASSGQPDAPPPGSSAGNFQAEATLPGVDPYSLVPFAIHVLREADGGPLHTSAMAERIYRLGFQHRWPPKYRDQLQRSLNALASPSQHPDKFKRVGPRTLKLR